MQQHPDLHWPSKAVAPPRSVVPLENQMHGIHSSSYFLQQQLEGSLLSQAYNHSHSCSHSRNLSGDFLDFNTPPEEYGPSMAAVPSRSNHSICYISEQSNPRVATFNTSPSPPQTYHIPCHQPSQDMLQDSSNSYSPISNVNSIPREPHYLQQRPQISMYALETPPSAERQAVVQLPNHLSQLPYQPTFLQDCEWYNNVTFLSPIEVDS